MTNEELRSILLPIIHCANASEWRGHAAGTLLVHLVKAQVVHSSSGSRDLEADVNLIEDEKGWNNIPWQGKRYPVKDSKGRPLYDSVEFPPEARDLHYHLEKRQVPDEENTAESPVFA